MTYEDDLQLNVVDEGGTPHVEQNFKPIPCCGDPTERDGGMHPWVLVTDNGPGDVYRCPECGAIDID